MTARCGFKDVMSGAMRTRLQLSCSICTVALERPLEHSVIPFKNILQNCKNKRRKWEMYM
jgi:predicted DNA repair protein MutK